MIDEQNSNQKDNDDETLEQVLEDAHGAKWKIRALFRQFVKFGIVGVTNTIISYVIYAAMVYAGCHYLVASVTSFVISVAWSFYWNNRMVFTMAKGETRSLWRSLVKTYMSYALTGLVLANVLLFLEIDILGLNAYIAPIINLVITVPINFYLNKNWAFKG